MAGPSIFQIEDGWVAFSLVDPAAVGYSADWQAPLGAAVDEVALADYGAGAADWRCQVTRGELTAAANDNNVEVPATFCSPASTVPQPGQTSFSVELEFLQDSNVTDGLSAYLFEFDTEEAFFVIGLAEEGSPPVAIGRCRLLAGNFGGPARENLTSTLSLPVVRKPDIWFGSVAPGRVVEGGDVAAGGLMVTGASAQTSQFSNEDESELADA